MTGVSPVTRKTVLDRDEHTCQWCGVGIWSNNYSLQHRRARGMGGTSRADANAPQNLVLVCGSATTGCHGRIESHRDEARGRGFNLMQGEEPLEVPLLAGSGRMWLLDELGGRKERPVSW